MRTSAAMGKTYHEIFHSTALIGLQQGVRLVVGVIQAKAVAVWLGAGGTGAFGLYAAFLNLAQSLFGFGLFGSGVRQIASDSREAPSGIPDRSIRALLTLITGLGLAGAAVIWAMRRRVGLWFFGDGGLVVDVGILAGALMVTQPGVGAMAVLQGLRRIRALTAANILGAVTGAIGAIIVIYARGAGGVAPAFLVAGLCSTLAAVVFLPKGNAAPQASANIFPTPTLRLFVSLLRLGSGFFLVSVLGAFSAMAVRALLVQRIGLEAAGLYQAGTMLASFYVGTLMQAMGTDFLPRLTRCGDRPEEFNEQLNDQLEAALILTIPGVLLCLAGAAPLLRLFYTGEFLAAEPAARWMLAAWLLRSAAWPLYYVPAALNRPGWMAASEAVHAIALPALTLLGLQWRGLEGAGMACLGAAAILAATQWGIARRLTSFSLSATARRVLAATTAAALVAFGLTAIAAQTARAVLWLWTMTVCAACAVYALRLLRSREPTDGAERA